MCLKANLKVHKARLMRQKYNTIMKIPMKIDMGTIKISKPTNLGKKQNHIKSRKLDVTENCECVNCKKYITDQQII